MNRNTLPYVLLIVLFFQCLIFSRYSDACGTVESFTNEYLATASDTSTKLHDLAMITCKPVIDGYKGTLDQDRLLAGMISSALALHDSCAATLALKNFLLFGQLQSLRGNNVRDQIIETLRENIGRSPEMVGGDMSTYAGQDLGDVCKQAQKEFDDIKTKGIAFCSGSDCAPICVGTVELPAEIEKQFKPGEPTEALLKSAKGKPKDGNLCDGKVYKATDDVNLRIYRLWNSTNPKKRLGNWWTFGRPEGKVAQYRSENNICYQHSPLDKMISCKVRAGAMIVVGTGQSMWCSEYLSYPPSPVNQIFIENPSSALYDCLDYDLLFNWLQMN